jgi:hypothetical protein
MLLVFFIISIHTMCAAQDTTTDAGGVNPGANEASTRAKDPMTQPSGDNLARPVGWDTCTHAKLMQCENAEVPGNKRCNKLVG